MLPIGTAYTTFN